MVLMGWGGASGLSPLAYVTMSPTNLRPASNIQDSFFDQWNFLLHGTATPHIGLDL